MQTQTMTGDSVGILHCDFMLLIRYKRMEMVISAFKAVLNETY